MNRRFERGAAVKWRRGFGWGKGVVREQYERPDTREPRKKNGQDAVEITYLIERCDGGRVLKHHSELELNL